MKVGLIGCGVIGRALLSHLAAAGADVKVVGVLVTDPAKHAPAAWKITTDAAEFLATGPELIVECAGQHAFAALVPGMLEAGYEVVAASAGALADADAGVPVFAPLEATQTRIQTALQHQFDPDGVFNTRRLHSVV